MIVDCFGTLIDLINQTVGYFVMTDRQPTDMQPIHDVYAKPGFYRWLALLAGLTAWTFDGVEQGVYTVMTRAALKDIVPGARELVQQADEFTANGMINEAAMLIKQAIPMSVFTSVWRLPCGCGERRPVGSYSAASAITMDAPRD